MAPDNYGKVLKVGFIGSGFIAQFHAQAMESIRNMELVGLYQSSRSESLAELSRKLGVGQPQIFKSVKEMANAVDAIALYCPNHLTLEMMEEVANAKKAGARVTGVIVEKPLGRNLKEARRFVQLAEEAGLLTAYFENQIHMKTIKTQKLQLAPLERSLGPLALTRSAEEHAGPHMPWFWDPRIQGGGVLNDMGCHSIAVGRFTLTPSGKDLLFLEPQSVTCEVGLLKWGTPANREKLKEKMGVDYAQVPAEDFATGIVTYKNPETGQLVKAQFTNSWMYDKQGLRLMMDGMGPGYAFEINTLLSPLQVFIGDEANTGLLDQEVALEKSTSTRGLLSVQTNEADLYGYIDENKDAASQFLQGKDALLNFKYGLEVTKLVMASYMSAEKKKTIDLTDPATLAELETYIPLIQQGRGKEVLF